MFYVNVRGWNYSYSELQVVDWYVRASWPWMALKYVLGGMRMCLCIVNKIQCLERFQSYVFESIHTTEILKVPLIECHMHTLIGAEISDNMLRCVKVSALHQVSHLYSMVASSPPLSGPPLSCPGQQKCKHSSKENNKSSRSSPGTLSKIIISLAKRFNLTGISSVINKRSIADFPPNRRRLHGWPQSLTEEEMAVNSG
ncbi:predicted protein [Sclerotinia sclerotiorum 1980 UF-70]|uniref:Uncharacterized protein n=1 Tax=Sclerotinia sclerotiorum (strain ATCC 18683 / 1980 / Ss-1) TaxID=665079 RepID=A7F5Q6_SCLS1|nr:predicted protein [Sclerotinia sclerotiorum 1980 UF-70]EDN98077.1 predicted protein [Sclerotinia sclerotiorum 1980 UF-70]